MQFHLLRFLNRQSNSRDFINNLKNWMIGAGGLHIYTAICGWWRGLGEGVVGLERGVVGLEGVVVGHGSGCVERTERGLWRERGKRTGRGCVVDG